MTKSKNQPNPPTLTKAIFKVALILYCLAALFTIRGLRPDIIYGSSVSTKPTFITEWYANYSGRSGGLYALIKDSSPEYNRIRSKYTSDDTRFTAFVINKSQSRKVEVNINRSIIFSKSIAAVQTGSLFYTIYTVWLISLTSLGALIWYMYRHSHKFQKLVPKNPKWIFVELIIVVLIAPLITSFLF